MSDIEQYGWLSVVLAPIGGAVGWLAGRRRYKAGTLSHEIANLGSWSAVYEALLTNFSSQQELIDVLSARSSTAELRASEAREMARSAQDAAARCEMLRAEDNAHAALAAAGLLLKIAERDERLAAMDLRITTLSGKVDRGAKT